MVSWLSLLTGVLAFSQATPAPAVYVVPQRPACDASLPDGRAVQFDMILSPAARSSPEVPWQLLTTIAAHEPDNAVAHIDVARCLYTFFRDLHDRDRLADAEQSLTRARALVREMASRQGVRPASTIAAPPYRTGRDVPVPERTRGRPPQYPSAARARQISGTLFIEATIDTSGSVRQTRVVGSIPPIDAEAERAVRSWRYRPSTIAGKRVEVVHLIALSFTPVPDPIVAQLDMARFEVSTGDYASAEAVLAKSIEALASRRNGITDVAAQRATELFRARRFKETPGLVEPRAIRNVEPKYTPEAMKNKIMGEVHMDLVLFSDGTMGPIRVTKSLDRVFGLDDAAIEAARQWRFEPAKDATGKGVPVIIGLIMEFRLH